ncbi:MAG: biotin--[acetyl-CoA-carboxylase] ligase [Proteobacteria bacterium]|nr:biotin--[acetyl-CoA-carboxylase] ligase [Candidatus Enterousia scatequi]
MATYKLISVGKIPSTQSYAHDLIARGNAGNNTVIIADAQTAGRGRFRRTWVSHHGNLYASFIYTCDERDARLAYSVAIAVAETLIAFGIYPNIKWPNDILVDAKKIAGILIEYYSRFVVVGIGINIDDSPTVPEYKTTKMADFVTVSREDVLNKLMKNMTKWINAGFSSVRTRWMDMAIGLNKTIKYQGSPAELIGINENGALVLRRESKYFLVYGDEIVM